MIRNKIGWQIFIVCYAITALSLWFYNWYSMHIYKKKYYEMISQNAKFQSQIIAREIIPEIVSDPDVAHIDSLCDIFGNISGTRLTIIQTDGKVLGDSRADPDTMENHFYRPEVNVALQGKTATEIRYSETLKQKMFYFTTPLINEGLNIGVIRIAIPYKEIDIQRSVFYRQLIVVSIFLFIIIGVATFLLIDMLSKPIRMMKIGAQRFANGDFNYKLQVPKSDELRDLARSLNAMASSLDERIQTVTRQRNELTAILVSLDEGVIAVDNDERLISLNPAARKILNIKEDSVSGRSIHEIVRNSALQKFLISTMSSKDRTETNFTLSSPEGELCIQAYGTLLINHDGNPQGAVIVFNDITRLRKLENLRKEFVANVSHELRTPLTSIKGFVETIRCGQYNLPEEVSRFLSIVSSKTDNLCSIVEDILTLSSIERDYEQREISAVSSNIRAVLLDAINTCHWKAVKKNIQIKLECPAEISCTFNAPLIEQAIVNLLDNAIKYSNENTEILIKGSGTETGVTFVVEDHGCGIAEEHLGRVFERFYRVDKARSRKLGGTGLGLSIVKNIATAHNGNVVVTSIVGKGSTFTINIPFKNNE